MRTPTGLVDVRVQFPSADRRPTTALKNVKVRTNDGSLVPIGDVADFTWTTAPTKIERLNRQRVVNVYGDVLPGYSLGQIVGPLQKKLQTPGFLPQGVGLKSQGNSQFMEETFTNMGIALITSFMLVYMLMVILYGSFLEPLIVMFSVPLAIIGALIFLALMGSLAARARTIAQHHLDARHRHALRPGREERHFARRLLEHALSNAACACTTPCCRPPRRASGRSS